MSAIIPEDACAEPPPGPVRFSVPSGTFVDSVTVALSTDEPDTQIRYTTDRTVPTATSPLYTEPLTFTRSTELRVQAFADDAPVGTPQAAVYVARAFDAQHDLPVIVLDAYGAGGTDTGTSGGFPFPGQQSVDRTWKDAALLTFEPKGALTSFTEPPTMASSAAYHLRGQSSALYDKKPYRLEVRDARGDDRDCPMLGMPPESDWVLHPPYPDKALIRNAFVYSLGPDLGLSAPRFAFAELYLNTADRPLDARDYQGVYLLVETIKNQKYRLDLKQLRPEDTTLPTIGGGYIVKFEWQVTPLEQELECPSTVLYCWDSLEVVDPEPINAEQRAYLAGFLGQVGLALHYATPSDPETGYPALIDTASFVNQVIVHELTRNIDAYTRSQYLYKDRNGKLFAGPLWDYDVIAGVGARSGFPNLSVEGFQYESVAARFSSTADWFPRLIADPVFHAALVGRWKELRAGVLSDAAISDRIARLTAGLARAAERNFDKWNNLTASRVAVFETPTDPTWEGQVASLRDWLLARAAWLDTQWK
ncbi:MAG: CotH kinase family protein [Pseudomonadota bacterium]